MRSAIVLFLCGGAIAALAQKPPGETDGYIHGDAPYLLEDGWRPLLNGVDLTGWQGQDPAKPNEWFVTRGVYWDRFYRPKEFSARKGPGGVIINGAAGRTVNLVTTDKFGDVELYLEFMVASGSNSGVYLHGLYEIQIFDSFGVPVPTSSDCGGVYWRWIDNHGVGGAAPKVNASRRPGEWQSFYIWFRAPRFDASGKKTENARFLRVLHNGVPVHDDIELEGPTRAHMNIPEAPQNPLMLQGDHGPVAFRNIYIRPLRPIVKK